MMETRRTDLLYGQQSQTFTPQRSGQYGSGVYTLGIDYGTNSVRTVVVRCTDGAEIGSCVVPYPSGKEGILLDRRNDLLARQHPLDYLVTLEKSVKGALKAAVGIQDFEPSAIVGIGVDSTGSSPLPVDKSNQALAAQPRWSANLDAQCWLWKDHTSWKEAEEITTLAAKKRPKFIAVCGNIYSSEWFWSKLLHCARVAPKVFEEAFSWVELADWIPSVLAGVTDPLLIKRGICAAGHKAMFSKEWGGLPDKAFLSLLDPRLADLRDRLYEEAYDASVGAGTLSGDWAKRLGLRQGIAIAIGEFDVHYGAIGCGVTEGTLVKVIGTSTCDCGVVSVERKVPAIPGICGIVNGSILPGYYGVEAGQSAVGDIFKWWVEGVCGGNESLHRELTNQASKLAPGETGLLALDWNNGNRTILVDQMLSGVMIGQTLYSTQAEIYRALIEATAFGARAIIERIREYGVPIDKVVCAGGIAAKNPLLMQIYADVTGCTMQVAASSQACALGGAISAAVLAGVHRDFKTAQRKMVSPNLRSFKPRKKDQKVYDQLYRLYRKLHDSFGGLEKNSDLSRVMKELISIKQTQKA